MIAAVVVSYNPARDGFIALIRRVAAQVDKVFVVDNSARDNQSTTQYLSEAGVSAERIVLIRLGENFGIAAALNVGIANALDEGAAFVLLSDQDSVPAPDMVQRLIDAYEFLTGCGKQVGAVAPTYTDIHTGLTHAFQAKRQEKLFYGHGRPTENAPHVEALTLITSGTLIPRQVLQSVGGMREDLFIDYVDSEWCHRARANGYSLFGTGWARMHQQLGEACLRVWYLRWRKESSYAPVRLYYRTRNFVALCGCSYIDWRWKVRGGWYAIGIIYTHCVFGAQRLQSLRMAAKGVWDGIRGRLGRYTG